MGDQVGDGDECELCGGDCGLPSKIEAATSFGPQSWSSILEFGVVVLLLRWVGDDLGRPLSWYLMPAFLFRVICDLYFVGSGLAGSLDGIWRNDKRNFG